MICQFINGIVTAALCVHATVTMPLECSLSAFIRVWMSGVTSNGKDVVTNHCGWLLAAGWCPIPAAQNLISSDDVGASKQ